MCAVYRVLCSPNHNINKYASHTRAVAAGSVRWHVHLADSVSAVASRSCKINKRLELIWYCSLNTAMAVDEHWTLNTALNSLHLQCIAQNRVFQIASKSTSKSETQHGLDQLGQLSSRFFIYEILRSNCMLWTITSRTVLSTREKNPDLTFVWKKRPDANLISNETPPTAI